ncbi:MAG: hypothetical protein C0410_05120 [Anaerolinea sp.]|nr:hypothetical protein [Anaerolinea sp.]
MTDYSRPETVSLDDLRTRIKTTDLVPSRAALLGDIDGIFERISHKGIQTWADLQKAIKNPKHMEVFSTETGIDLEYLVLLRREVEGYSPKPFNLKDIDWAPQEAINKLIENGITNSDSLFSKLREISLRKDFADKIGIDLETMNYLVNLASLCRVQWVSPTAGRMLIEADYETCQKLASTDKGELFTAMDRVNKKGKYFNGTIGARDINRIIDAAKYVV